MPAQQDARRVHEVPIINKFILLGQSVIDGEPCQDRPIHMTTDGVYVLLGAREGPFMTSTGRVFCTRRRKPIPLPAKTLSCALVPRLSRFITNFRAKRLPPPFDPVVSATAMQLQTHKATIQAPFTPV